VHFPKSCLHCEDAPCVTVCPTGASYKRAEDGIVLVNEDLCIGCGLCAWACPYGAREMDPIDGVMKKCTLCVDRIYNDTCPRKTGTRLRAHLPPARGISAISAIRQRCLAAWSPSAAAST
jgi:Fe-S-cluster-containing dehydrogenase component